MAQMFLPEDAMRRFKLFAAVVVTAAAAATGAAAQNFATDPIYDSPLFNFEGFYAGVQLGGANVPGPGFVWTAGVVAGVNFALNQAILGGLEFQGGASFNGTGMTGADVLLLGHVGGYVTDQLMVYGALGAGWVNSAGSYAFGAGVEMPLTDQISVRGEVLGTGTWGASPNGARASAGVLFHMN